ncbi:MAG: DUF4340 domain-containing protein [Bacteroides sp.]|nr:DUF4340 domain-containing protein [Prevotella sp.]MCM1407381.1 DUF4340 domain-containing protein [Treponema brennaborense]MCM1469871.1 DUF4340 domain-containing protein [Bacteroides sp.]
MKTIKNRKVILLACIGFLVAVYICQLIFAAGSKVKDIRLDGTIDKYIISLGGELLEVVRNDGSWFVGEKKYPADNDAVNEMNETAEKIRVLGTVSRGADSDRYGLDDSSAVVVEVQSAGKTIRSMRIGKASVTSRQTYMQLDGAKDVLLVSGDAAAAFSKSIDDLREKSIYDISLSDIARIASESDRDSFAIEKAGDPPEWVRADITDSEQASALVDTEKAAAWAGSVMSLRARSFAEDDAVLPDEGKNTVTLTTVSGKNIVVSLSPAAEEGSYICSCSETPYLFYLSSYAAERYIKTADDLKK